MSCTIKTCRKSDYTKIIAQMTSMQLFHFNSFHCFFFICHFYKDKQRLKNLMIFKFFNENTITKSVKLHFFFASFSVWKRITRNGNNIWMRRSSKLMEWNRHHAIQFKNLIITKNEIGWIKSSVCVWVWNHHSTLFIFKLFIK